MKKIISIASLGLLVVALGACGNQKKETKASQSSTSVSQVESSSENTSTSEKEKREVSTLQGTIENVGEKTLTLASIEGVSDPEDMANIFQTDGVVVNLTKEVLEAANLEMSAFKTGSFVQIGIAEGTPITQSLPPQVTVESIKLVE